MKWIFQRFFSPLRLCGTLRFQCAAWSDLGVRLTPISLCDMLRFMHTHAQQFANALLDYIRYSQAPNASSSSGKSSKSNYQSQTKKGEHKGSALKEENAY